MGCRPVDPIAVDDTIARAREIADLYTAHALAVFDLIASDPATDAAQTALRRLQRPRTDGTWRTTINRRAAVAASRRFRTVGQTEPALALLEAHGYLRAEERAIHALEGRDASYGRRVRARPGTGD